MAYKRVDLETDVLVVGGGMAGAIAAIKARDEGASVIVLEKSNTYRSGNGGAGNDHIFSYIPPVHEKVGYTIEQMIEEQKRTLLNGIGLGIPELAELFIRKSYDHILDLERYGVNFRFEDSQIPGNFRVVTQFHSIPTTLHYDGRDIKVKLTRAMIERKVQIINRAFVVELIKHEGKVTGAIAVGTREDILYVVSAKTTILATGGNVQHLSPGNDDSEKASPGSANFGAGKVLALNAGAEVINLEFLFGGKGAGWLHWAFSAGAPGGTFWPATRVVDEADNVIVDRMWNYSLDDPDYLEKHRKQVEKYARQRTLMTKYLEEGKQVYLDFGEAKPEEIERIKWSMFNEGKEWLLLQFFEEKQIDFFKVRIPLRLASNIAFIAGSFAVAGVYVDTNLETTVENLFAAGDENAGAGVGGGPKAIVFGHEAGINAARRAQSIPAPDKPDEEQISRVLKRVTAIYEEKEGDRWQDIKKAIQQIAVTFGTSPHTDVKLDNALELLAQLRWDTRLSAENPHELTRSLEVEFLLETAQAIFTAAKQRRKSYGPFRKEAGASDRAFSELLSSDGQQALPEAEIIGITRNSAGGYLISRRKGKQKVAADRSLI